MTPHLNTLKASHEFARFFVFDVYKVISFVHIHDNLRLIFDSNQLLLRLGILMMNKH